MILKVACAAVLALVSAPAVPQAVESSPIPKVVCPVQFGYSMGSAVRIGPHLLISAKHVTSFPACFIDGHPIKVIYTSPDRDYSLLSDERTGARLKVDCGGFVAGRKYLAVGHARGLDQLTTIELMATGASSGGFDILTGVFTVIPGQSGGAIVDAETGKLVGLVNVYDMPAGRSGSVPLKDTPVCRS